MATSAYVCLACGEPSEKARPQGATPRWCPSCRGKYALRECPGCGETKPIRIQATYCSATCSAAALRDSTSPNKSRGRGAPGRHAVIRRVIESGNPEDILRVIRHCSDVVDSGCWLWNLTLTPKGYPAYSIAGRRIQIHRLAWEAANGLRLGSQQAHHTCATPACVNPSHIIPATHADNILEMKARTAMEARIRELEAALYAIAPEHPIFLDAGLKRSKHISKAKRRAVAAAAR